MMRVMFTGLSGVVNHQLKLDVVANNVSNVNTVAFKAGRTNFENFFAQNVTGALRANAESRFGGRNPLQVGLGVRTASIGVNMNQGNIQTTHRPLDAAIEGPGFFIVGGEEGRFLTRNGNFQVDVIDVPNPDHDLAGSASPEVISLFSHLHMDGHPVFGWDSAFNAETGRYEIVRGDEIAQINFLDGKEVYNARATTRAIFQGNLDPIDGHGFASPFSFYDSNGTEHEASVVFSYDHENRQWTFRVVPDNEGMAFSPEPWGPDGEPFEGHFGVLTFDRHGIPTFDEGFDIYVQGADGITSLNFDFTNIRQHVGPANVHAYDVDGNAHGRLINFQIDPNGVITGLYSNSRDRVLWQLAIAAVPNPMGLYRRGDGLFSLSETSGGIDPETGGWLTMESPTIRSGALEMSNVDMGFEMVNMITAQRGFQASSRLITTADEMIQTARDLKR